MARKKQSEKPKKNAIPNAYIAGAGIVEEEKITDLSLIHISEPTRPY